MRRSTRILLMATMIIIAIGLALPVCAQTKAAAPAVPAALAEKAKININTATADQLATLKGIGPKLADSIIEYRKANGPFKDVTDLIKVNGIGPKTFEDLKDFITVK